MKNDLIRFIVCYIEITTIGSILFLVVDYLENRVISLSYLIDKIHIILSVGLICTIIFYLRYCARHNNDEQK